MAKRYDLEILEANRLINGKSRFVVKKINYRLKHSSKESYSISTIFVYIFESDFDYSMLINDYNEGLKNKEVIRRQICSLAIKRGMKKFCELNSILDYF